jgi:hypothetical protein
VQKLCHRYPAKIKLIRFNKPTETTDKMAAYLKLIEDGDYFLRLNGDEILSSQFNSISLHNYISFHIKDTGELPLYQIAEYHDGHPQGYHYSPKLIKKTSALKLTSTHLALTNKFNPAYELYDEAGGCKYSRGMVSPMKANIMPALLSIRHMKDHRNPQRQKQNVEWVNYYRKHQLQQGVI